MPHYTPLRYPGGKQRLAPFILEILEANKLVGGEYVEPYAGGAGVAIELLLTGKVARIHLNDSCGAIFSFWRALLNHTDQLCERILQTPLTVLEWKRQREILSRKVEFDDLDIGFSTFYLNRCNRSGIVAGGGLIGGLKQTGNWKMDARFPREKLVERVRAIAKMKNAIVITNLDAEVFMLKVIPALPTKTLVYCDPPYYKKANRLYFNHYAAEDHARIANVIKSIRLPWVVSYDNAAAIRKAYTETRYFCYRLQHTAAAARKGSEAFFFGSGVELPKESVVPFVNRALKRYFKSPSPNRAL